MDSFQITLLLLTFAHTIRSTTSEAYSTEFAYPINISTKWSIVQPSVFTCPQSHMMFNPMIHDILFEVRVRRPAYQPELLVDGYLCTKTEYSSICDDPWVGSNQESQTETILPVPLTGCQWRVAEFEAGTYKELQGLPITCVYGRVTTLKRVEISVVPHHVTLDPYSYDYIDPIFPLGRTKHGSHAITVENKMWIPRRTLEIEKCNQGTTYHGQIYAKKASNPEEDLLYHGRFHVEGHRDKTLKGACRMSYCGGSGIRFSDGEWFAVEAYVNTENHTNKLKSLLPVCDASTTISLNTGGVDSDAEFDTAVDLIYRIKCYDVWAKHRNGERISPYDLSFLSQSYPGVGLAYKQEGGLLKQALARYVMVNVSTMNSKLHKIGEYNQIEVFGQFPEKSEYNENVQYGVNGLLSIDGQVTLPRGILTRSSVSVDIISGETLYPVSHPRVVSVANTTDGLHYIYYKAGDGSNIFLRLEDAALGWFSSLSSPIKWLVGIGLTFVGLALLTGLIKLIVWIRRCCFRGSGSSRAESRRSLGRKRNPSVRYDPENGVELNGF